MKKIFLLSLMLFLYISLFAVIEESASLQDFIYGTTENCQYDNWLSHTVENKPDGDNNIYAPFDVQTPGFGSYIPPDSLQINSWAQIVTAIISQNLQEAENIINENSFPYNIVHFYDTDTQRYYYMLRERLSLEYTDQNETPDYPDDDVVGSFDYGWGLYIFSPQDNNPKPVIVNVPHPNDDFISAPVAVKAFQTWNANFLMIAGAGRSVYFSGDHYYNSSSLSDPTRNPDTIFHTTYKIFCNYVEENLINLRELSIQFHSFDYHHFDSKDIELSYIRNPFPAFPIYDISSNHFDLIHFTPFIVHPENEFLSNSHMVSVPNYYAVNAVYTVQYNDEIQIQNFVRLPGYYNNQQMLYSKRDFNRYSVYWPFTHIELAELPHCFPSLDNETYKMFYGYNPYTDHFDLPKYENAVAYYTPLINAINQALQYYPLNDGELPSSTEIISYNFDYEDFTLNFEWTPVDCFDFYSYNINFSDSPFNGGNYSFVNREQYPELASPSTTSISITPQLNTNYFYSITSQDYSDNISNFSNSVQIQIPNTRITHFKAIGRDNCNIISWEVISQSDNQGFNIYKKIEDGTYNLLDSWQNNSNLQGSTQENITYTYTDSTAQNGTFYTYKISSVNLDNTEFFYNQESSCKPAAIFRFDVYTQNSPADTFFISQNEFASNNFDDYDTICDTTHTDNYFYAYTRFSTNEPLTLDVINNFDPENEMRIFHTYITTNQSLPNVSIFFNNPPEENQQLFLLYDTNTDETYSLSENPTIPLYGKLSHYLLLWGFTDPNITNLDFDAFQTYRPGDTLSISFDKNNFYDTYSQYTSIYLTNYSDSILIAQNITDLQNNYTFTLPDIYMQNAHFFFKIKTLKGNFTYIHFPYQFFSILPNTVSYSFDEGNYTISNPCFHTNYYYQDIFGDTSELYSYINSFTHNNYFTWNHSYLLKTSQNINLTFPTQTLDYSDYPFVLHQGWNLITNNTFFTIYQNMFRFTLSSNYHFYNQVQENNISPIFYIYDKDEYKATQNIEPMQSAFMYVHQIPNDDYGFYYKLYSTNQSNIDLPLPEWFIKISANTPNSFSDTLQIGISSQATNNFDNIYDMPAPPDIPDENYLSIYSYHNIAMESSYPYDKFKTDIRGSFNEYEKVWRIFVKVPENQNILNLSFLFSENYPADYIYTLSYNGNDYNFESNNQITLNTQGERIVHLSIHIQNPQNHSQDDNIAPLSVKVFPNPAKSGKINFLLDNQNKNANSTLKIYNIKGQKVVTLKNDGNKFVWNGRNENKKIVGSGIYFYKIINGNETKKGKFVILK